jgi:uroporphyrinogen decarboxylase
MNPRNMVKAAFRFEQTDEIPHWISIGGGDIERRLVAHYGTTNWREGRLKTYMAGGHIDFAYTPLSDGTYLDAFGTNLQPGNVTHIIKPALEKPALDGYRWPDVKERIDWDAFAREITRSPELFHLRGLAFGLFERAWQMRGFENFLMDLHEHPGFVDELLDGILDIHLQAIDQVAARLKVDAYFGGDDFCDQRGLIMGPDLWRRFFKPRQARLVERCHQAGLPMVMHSCGNVLPMVEDLMEIGLDGLESLQPEAMDLLELRRRTEGRMVLIGGVGVQRLLPFGTPEEIRCEVRRLMTEMTRRGVYILAAAKALMDDTPTANAVALIEAARNNNRSLLR